MRSLKRTKTRVPNRGAIQRGPNRSGRQLHREIKRNQALSQNKVASKHDVTIVGPHIWGDGIGKIGYSLYDILSQDYRVNMITLFDGVNHSVFPSQLEYLKKVPITFIKSFEKKDIADTVIFTGIVWAPGKHAYVQSSYIQRFAHCKNRIAISMLESSKIPTEWVAELNKYYTKVTVPSHFLVKVYRDCGVKIPIECVPLPMPDLTLPLSQSPQKKQSKDFTFGMIAGTWKKKNVPETMIAFQEAFPGNNNVKLKVHARFGYSHITEEARKVAATDNRIDFTTETISGEQLENWSKTIDCYVLPSAGEGYSYTPREMLAKGVPCILSSGHAHDELIKESGAIGLRFSHLVPAEYDFLTGCGMCWQPDFKDLVVKMRYVVENFTKVREQTDKARATLARFTPKRWKELYQSTFYKPKMVVLNHWAPGHNTPGGGMNEFSLLVDTLADRYDITWIYYSPKEDLLGTTTDKKYKCLHLSRSDGALLSNTIQKINPDILFSFAWNSLYYIQDFLGGIKTQGTKVSVWAENVSFLAGEQSLKDARLEVSKEVYRKEAKNKPLELASYSAADSIFCVSQKDTNSLKSVFPKKNIVYLPIASPDSKYVYTGENNDTILFLGGTWHRGNLDALDYFMEQVKPHLKKDIKIEVCGKASDDYCLSGFSSILKKYPEIINFGYIENLEKYLVEVMTTIAPIVTGGGVKVKVLTSASTRTPCIMTGQVAEELDLEKQSMLVGLTAQEFATKINKLQESKDYRLLASKEMEKIAMQHSTERRDKLLLNSLRNL